MPVSELMHGATANTQTRSYLGRPDQVVHVHLPPHVGDATRWPGPGQGLTTIVLTPTVAA